MQSAIATAQQAKPTCRVCLESEDDAHSFVTPCSCSGSMQYAHKPCIERWIAEQMHNDNSKTPVCEVCRQPYTLELYQGAIDQAIAMSSAALAVPCRYSYAVALAENGDGRHSVVITAIQDRNNRAINSSSHGEQRETRIVPPAVEQARLVKRMLVTLAALFLVGLFWAIMIAFSVGR